MTSFVHLHCHNEYSLLDGFGKADKWIEIAKELGFTHIGLTNHSNVDGVIRWQKECKKADIKAVIGTELYIVEDINDKAPGERRYHVTVLVKNDTGWENLLKMLTVANVNGFYYKPRVDPDILLDYLDGLVVLTGCASTFLLMNGGVNLLKKIKKKTQVFLEVMPHCYDEQVEVNKLCLEYHKRYKMPLIATNDCHYIKEEHDKLHEVLLAMQTKKKWTDADRFKLEIKGLHLRTAEEMKAEFIKQGVLNKTKINHAIKQTFTAAKLCEYEVKKQEVYLPKVGVKEYNDLTEDEQLINLTYDGLEKLRIKFPEIAENFEEYEARIEEELLTIMDLGFERYFLIVWELVKWCKENDIMVGPNRGSVGGCLVAYCLGITTVDPIKYRLIFSRFISAGRIDLPDIDMDFEDIKRPLIRKHLEKLYGKWNVVTLSTFTKMNGRGAIRDASRVFDIPLGEVDKAAKSIVVRAMGDARSNFTIEDAFETFEDGIEFKKKYPEVTKIAMALEGQIKGTSTHAAAMCVARDDLRSGKNANYAKRKNELMCNWDKKDAEHMGLMKLDILGLNALTLLNECKKLVKKRKGIDIEYETINLEDPKLYEEFTKGNTSGIFQFNSPFITKLCKEVVVDDFNQLVDLNALNRPGCIRSGMTSDYRDRKHKRQEVKFSHPTVEEFTSNTYGLILYQEQIMYLMYGCGGLPWSTADNIRKVVGKSEGEEEFLKWEDTFVEGCKKRGTLDEETARKVFEELKYFGSYGFNKSHSVGYSLISAWLMHLKVYHFEEFIATWLSYGSDEDRKKEVFDEARKKEMRVILPDVNNSDGVLWELDEDNNLLMPLQEVKGIGPATVKNILKDKKENGDFKSFEDFDKRLTGKKCNKRVKGILQDVRAFEFDKNKKMKLSDEDLEKLTSMFEYEMTNDPMFRYRKVINLIRENIDIGTIDNLHAENAASYYFGKMMDLRFTYKDDIGGSTGGVWGMLDDGTNPTMLIFTKDVYTARKHEVEHSKDKWLLVQKASEATHKSHHLISSNFWLAEELLKGEVKGLGLRLARETIHSEDYYYLGSEMQPMSLCTACELRNECSQVVLPSPGKFNAMIIGEAPGFNEDKDGMGFVGDAGDLLWRVLLEEFSLTRDLFHVTNVCKCYPKITKTPKNKHIKACRHWLEKEIRATKPFIIFAQGNTCLNFFKGEEGGIIKQVEENPIEWSNHYNCWICWSVHPALALRNPDKMPLYRAGVENFGEKFALLGFNL
jgi:DNA polymerase-3 subunit alpha